MEHMVQEIETYSNLEKYDITYIKSIEDSSIIDKDYGTRMKKQTVDFFLMIETLDKLLTYP